MAKRKRLTPQQVADVLNEVQGLVYVAAERLGCSAKTVYNYVDRYPVVREAKDHQKGKRLDTAEASLWKAVVAGEAWAVCFYLQTQGKARGYTERREVTGRDGAALQVDSTAYDMSLLSHEDRLVLLDLLDRARQAPPRTDLSRLTDAELAELSRLQAKANGTEPRPWQGNGEGA